MEIMFKKQQMKDIVWYKVFHTTPFQFMHSLASLLKEFKCELKTWVMPMRNNINTNLLCNSYLAMHSNVLNQ